MVVDDDPDVVLSIKQLLEGSSDEYVVSGADSGIQCLKLLKNNKLPDLILLDIMMPEMNGWDTFYKLRENPFWNKIPVIFLTVRTDKAAEYAGRFLGAEYMTKPFDVKDLKERIDKVLKNTVYTLEK